MSSSLEQKLNEVRNSINNNPDTSNYIDVDEWSPLRCAILDAVIQSLPKLANRNTWATVHYVKGREDYRADILGILSNAKSPSPGSEGSV